MSPSYKVYLTRDADKDLTRLRKWKDRAGAEIRRIRDEPEAGHTLTGVLRGARSLEFSLSGGAHRAAYVIKEDERACLVFVVGPHENFYKKAERRYHALRKRGEL